MIPSVSDLISTYSLARRFPTNGTVSATARAVACMVTTCITMPPLPRAPPCCGRHPASTNASASPASVQTIVTRRPRLAGPRGPRVPSSCSVN